MTKGKKRKDCRSFIDTITKRQRKRYETTAYHEAGHVILAHLLNLPKSKKVTIIPADEYYGKTSYVRARLTKSDEEEFLSYLESPKARLKFEKQCIAKLAGPLAEKKYAGRLKTRLCLQKDYEAAEKIACRICRDLGPSYCKGVSAYLNWIEVLTKSHIENPSTWKKIERFAKILLEKGELKGNDLKLALIEVERTMNSKTIEAYKGHKWRIKYINPEGECSDRQS
ncbi:MAG: hypothetical protein GY847_25335 [Proteobacteria bacterium]|nr:hypothetical protein [Pseudomonadota bacterium]